MDRQVALGPLRDDDVDDALTLSDVLGWNKIADDWLRIIRLEPHGCFAARDGSRLIGTVTTTTYQQTLAWVGMMIVHPDFQRQGVGAALMQKALDYVHELGIATVKLDATPAGRPLYESMGFVVEAEIERWLGTAPRRRAGEHPEPHTEWRAAPDVRRLLNFDEAAFRADRSRLIAQLISECPGGPLVASSISSPCEGYALARTGQTSSYIGPLVAVSARTARQLLDGMLARLAGHSVCLDLHHNGLLDPSVLVEHGLSKQRNLTRMCHGPSSDAATTGLIAASAGPEFG